MSSRPSRAAASHAIEKIHLQQQPATQENSAHASKKRRHATTDENEDEDEDQSASEDKQKQKSRGKRASAATPSKRRRAASKHEDENDPVATSSAGPTGGSKRVKTSAKKRSAKVQSESDEDDEEEEDENDEKDDEDSSGSEEDESGEDDRQDETDDAMDEAADDSSEADEESASSEESDEDEEYFSSKKEAAAARARVKKLPSDKAQSIPREKVKKPTALQAKRSAALVDTELMALLCAPNTPTSLRVSTLALALHKARAEGEAYKLANPKEPRKMKKQQDTHVDDEMKEAEHSSGGASAAAAAAAPVKPTSIPKVLDLFNINQRDAKTGTTMSMVVYHLLASASIILLKPLREFKQELVSKITKEANLNATKEQGETLLHIICDKKTYSRLVARKTRGRRGRAYREELQRSKQNGAAPPSLYQVEEVEPRHGLEVRVIHACVRAKQQAWMVPAKDGHTPLDLIREPYKHRLGLSFPIIYWPAEITLTKRDDHVHDGRGDMFMMEEELRCTSRQAASSAVEFASMLCKYSNVHLKSLPIYEPNSKGVTIFDMVKNAAAINLAELLHHGVPPRLHWFARPDTSYERGRRARTWADEVAQSKNIGARFESTWAEANPTEFQEALQVHLIGDLSAVVLSFLTNKADSYHAAAKKRLLETEEVEEEKGDHAAAAASPASGSDGVTPMDIDQM
jgi:hypothetical protein